MGNEGGEPPQRRDCHHLVGRDGVASEGTTKYGPNVVSFMIKEGWEKSFVVKSYVTPNNQQTLHSGEQALAQ